MLLLPRSGLAQPPAPAPQPPVAQPAPDETQRRAVAQALFDEAQKLIAAKSFALACPKLEEVVLLQPGKIGAILALARCYESDGKIASAWSRFKNVVEAAKVAGDAREAEAQKKVDELDKRLPRLTLVVGEALRAVPGLSIKRDGVDVREPQWGLAIPLDAGVHRIEVTAPGKKAWTSEATLEEGRTITLDVPGLAPEQEAPPPAPTASVQLPPVSTAPPDTGAPASFLGLPGKTWGLVVGGAGVAGLLAGGVAGGLALGQHDALAKACPNGRCPAGKQGDVDAYEATGLASTIGFAAGGALVAAGAALWLFSPGRRPATAAGVRPYATFGGAGVTGRF